MRFAIVDDRLVPMPLLPAPYQTFPISKIPLIPIIPCDSEYLFNSSLQAHLSGKQLLLEEIPFSLHELQQHYEHGCLSYTPGIILKQNKAMCARCGSSGRWLSEFPCARCEENCLYCRKCLEMGRVSACSPLVSWTGPLQASPFSSASKPLLEWKGRLSEGQAEASRQVEKAMADRDELLVWAVCGAGKTEVLFKGIERALSCGGRICIATPRTDVVLELAPRLQAAFPEVPIAALYGGSADRHLPAMLTVATTHQLLRFYQAFDALVVDEVDAFPYSAEEILEYAAGRARKPESALIYLSATPNGKWQAECRKGTRKYVTIPARFHRRALPEPAFQWCGNWEKKLVRGQLPANLIIWCRKSLSEGRQVLVFVPKIKSMEKLLPIFRKMVHSETDSVHAEDPLRKEKVMKMRNKELPLLLTTTILERGVTFSNLDVAVLGAEDRVFGESALVQIAGRAGRSVEYPFGKVVFFHFGKTKAMIKAKAQIRLMNKQARVRGLLD